MNKKEITEIRRRLASDKNNIPVIYGCYVSNSLEIISSFEAPAAFLPEFEAEKYLGFLKRTLSGTIGKNLIDIVFSNQQVMDSEEHRLLMDLKNSNLTDKAAREKLFGKIISGLEKNNEISYLILLACDTYDVPYRGTDDIVLEDSSDTVFTYFICCVCPVKDGKPQLGYDSGEKGFLRRSAAQIVSAPSCGFMFPTFDDRAANIYNALFYTRDSVVIPESIIENVFHTEIPMSAGNQKAVFSSVLENSLEEDCSFEVARELHNHLREKIEIHKGSKNPEQLDISPEEISNVLKDNGVSPEKADAFVEECGERFGSGSPLIPGNISDAGKFRITTPKVSITVDPGYTYFVETRILEGRKFILIPANEGVELNGMEVIVTGEEE